MGVSGWPGGEGLKALVVSILSLVAAVGFVIVAAILVIIPAIFAPPKDDIEPNGIGVTVFLLLAAASVAFAFGSFCAFVVLCFFPLRAVHKSLSQIDDI